jgi:hypothetical protein
MDRVEILCDAYKESYIQARRMHRATILVGIFSLLVILLVIRDSLIIENAGPKISEYEQRLEGVEHQIQETSSREFSSPGSYHEAKANYDAAKQSLDAWHKNLPARTKMQARYNSLLAEYSGSHGRVLERLKIDGEPGLDLYAELKKRIVAMEEAQFNLDAEIGRRARLERSFEAAKAEQALTLNREKEHLSQAIAALRSELARLQRDQTRIPWLGLRVNPKDLLSLIPVLLLFFFHILFDKFDETLYILRKPELEEVQDALKVYPVPVFFDRRSIFSLSTMVILYGLIPLVQITSVVMIFAYHIPMFGLGPNSWTIAGWVGVIACVITLWYPIMLFRKHKEIMLSKNR